MPGMRLSEYRVTNASGVERHFVRINAVEAALASESEDDPIRQIQFLRSNLDVALPEVPVPVYFHAYASPTAAVDAHCKVAPETYTVNAGTSVIFQALPTPGFVFDGWYLSSPIDPDNQPENWDPEVPISTDATVVIPIYAPAPGQTRAIEARFAPAP